jgi:hypothetical protein
MCKRSGGLTEATRRLQEKECVCGKVALGVCMCVLARGDQVHIGRRFDVKSLKVIAMVTSTAMCYGDIETTSRDDAHLCLTAKCTQGCIP